MIVYLNISIQNQNKYFVGFIVLNKKFENKSFSILLYNIIMKTNETLKEMHPKINSLLGEIDAVIKEDSKKIKKEFLNNLSDVRINLLKEICDGENLNFQEIKNKYLTDKEIKNIIDISDTKEVINEPLLDTVLINGKTYFFENKDKGIIFDSKSKPVGVFKNGVHTLTS